MSKTLTSKKNEYMTVEVGGGQVELITAGDFRSNGAIFFKGNSRHGTYKNLLESMQTVFEEDEALYRAVYKYCHVKDNLIDPNTLKIKINNERVSELDSEISDMLVKMLELRNEKVLLMHETLHAQTLLINTVKKYSKKGKKK
jgi:hypothetical protein